MGLPRLAAWSGILAAALLIPGGDPKRGAIEAAGVEGEWRGDVGDPLGDVGARRAPLRGRGTKSGWPISPARPDRWPPGFRR